jgi:hypothetical protein
LNSDPDQDQGFLMTRNLTNFTVKEMQIYSLAKIAINLISMLPRRTFKSYRICLQPSRKTSGTSFVTFFFLLFIFAALDPATDPPIRIRIRNTGFFSLPSTLVDYLTLMNWTGTCCERHEEEEHVKTHHCKAGGQGSDSVS